MNDLLRDAIEKMINSYERRAQWNVDLTERALMTEESRRFFNKRAQIFYETADELRQVLLMVTMQDAEVTTWDN